MKKVLQITHTNKPADVVQATLDGAPGVPGYLTAYATHSKKSDDSLPDTVILLCDCSFAKQQNLQLPKGTRFAWLSDEEYARLHDIRTPDAA